MTPQKYILPRGTYLAVIRDAAFTSAIRKNTSPKAFEETTELMGFNYELLVMKDSGEDLCVLCDGFEIKEDLCHNSPVVKFKNALNVDLEDLPEAIRGKKVVIATNIMCVRGCGVKAYVEDIFLWEEGLSLER
ncbi:MAG: hypothetical protein AB7E95_07725 [Kiritimatiellales bacterium]